MATLYSMNAHALSRAMFGIYTSSGYSHLSRNWHARIHCEGFCREEGFEVGGKLAPVL
jgi:hypothetical protein